MKFFFPVLLVLLGLLVACKPDPAPEVATSEMPLTQALDPTVFAPKVGYTLVYDQMTRLAKKDAKLPLKEGDVETKRITRVQRYEGPHVSEGNTYHRFSIREDGSRIPDLLLDYRQDTLFVVAKAEPDGTFRFDKLRIPLAQKEMKVGTFWRWPPGAEGTSGFRCVSHEEVRLPAGVFDAYKVTYQGDQGGTVSLKDYWFTPGVGIVREESRSYRGGLLRAQSVIELKEIIRP